MATSDAQRLCYNFRILHQHAADGARPGFFTLPDPDMVNDESGFHECAANVYKAFRKKLRDGDDCIETLQQVHARLLDATARADWNACISARDHVK